MRDNVAFSPRARGASRRAARAAAATGSTRLGLADLADRRPAELSGGQAQRVALARALAGDPALLLLDEPLAALDARTRLDVQAELKRHLADFAGPCLLVTHDPLEALVLADRLLVLERRPHRAGGHPGGGRPPPGHRVRRPAGGPQPVPRAAPTAAAVGARRRRARFVVPDHGQRGDVLVGAAPVRGHRQHPAAAAHAARATPGRPRSRASPCSPTGCGSTSSGQPSALVDVTPAAVAELGLDPGQPVWLSAKATDLEVYPHNGAEVN